MIRTACTSSGARPTTHPPGAASPSSPSAAACGAMPVRNDASMPAAGSPSAARPAAVTATLIHVACTVSVSSGSWRRVCTALNRRLNAITSAEVATRPASRPSHSRASPVSPKRTNSSASWSLLKPATMLPWISATSAVIWSSGRKSGIGRSCAATQQ
jgi:hypothetical protein